MFISVTSLLLTIACGIGLYILVNSKVNAVQGDFGNTVSKNELTTVAESAEARLGRIEGELKKTMLRVDSLKNMVTEIKSGSVIKKPAPKQRYYRKK